MVQAVPFHNSASVVVANVTWSVADPTAMQEVTDEHEMPDSWAVAPAGLEIGTIDHLVPFHRSASGA